MKRALVLDVSPRGDGSRSRRASAQVVERLMRRAPGLEVIRRDLAVAPPPPIDDAFAHAMLVPAAQRTADQHRALHHSEALIAELEGSDALVIATPMHNFTVPAALKTWIDQVLRFDRTFRSTPEGKVGLLADRPTYVVVASGGAVVGDRARQPDFLTPYLTAVLATLGIRTVDFLHLDPVPRGVDCTIETRDLVRSWLDGCLPI
ncbi:MAG: NAD(P)H-dependent oxidoreductase [Proteobacteria bacterium]|nr:NAD(P)H-dependent oxidoreductase [Pseudomonadota bacterium]